MIFRESRLVSSYSQINLFEQCPYRWYLKYVLEIESDLKSKHLEYGLATHSTLEYFFNELKEGYTPPLNLLKDIFKYEINKRKVPFDSSEEEMEWLMEGFIELERLYKQPTDFEKMLINSEIIGVEHNFEIPIQIPPVEITYTDEFGEEHTFEQNVVKIIGFIDLILKTNEGIICIDHKSGGRLYKPNKLKTDLQFPIYGMAIKQDFEELPIRNIYNFTRLHKYQEVEVNDEIIEEAKKRIIKTFKKMSNKKYTPKPSNLCYWCDYSYHKLNECKYSSKFKPKNK